MSDTVEMWDVVVVGAGPAGAVAATLLSRRGWRVLLVEKSAWPRDKACGGCLNAAGTRLLRSLGLESALADGPALTQMRLISGAREAAFELPAGTVIERARFDACLADAAVAAGAAFLPHTHARLLPGTDGQSRELSLTGPADTRVVRASVVLACSGIAHPHRGLLAHEGWAAVSVAEGSHIGCSFSVDASRMAGISEGELLMHLAPEGYVGVVRTAGGQIHIGAALNPQAAHEARGPLALIRRILRGRGDVSLEPGTPLVGTGPLTVHRDIVGNGRVLAIGDAAGYVEPFTGEGISWALHGAVAATDIFPQSPADLPDTIGARWNDHFHLTLKPRQSWCTFIRPLLRVAPLRTLAITVAGLSPPATARVARQICA